MNSRKDLETRIARRLETLTPEDMQRVAEDYARLRFPDRFPRFDFRALSPGGKSRCGWPDAYVVLPNGRVDGVEATTRKSKSKIWKHLGEDVAKARDRTPKLSGFVFVSGQPAIQPDADELRTWRQRFADEAGLVLERVDLVFGGQLVQELARPEFARTRVEILGLPDLPGWFELVRPAVPPDSPQAEFIPSPDEYESGWVQRPQDADRILDLLEKEGRALLRGVGASGKTVLAWLLALETTRAGWPAYYLDLARLGERVFEAGNGLEDDLVRFGHPRVLFILDNIHLDERLAKRLAVAWGLLTPSQRPRLLLVGRELHTRRGSPITGLDIPTVPLKARQIEVRGVYRRLVWRKTGSSTIVEPPLEVLDRWVSTFGGDPTSPDTTTDLIAFSAAVLKRLPDLAKQNWVLTEKDAVDEIREVYLKRLGVGEIGNLMRLAVLADFELSLNEAALVDQQAGFDVASRRLGLVFREQAGAQGQYVRYRLAHPALGRLLLAATFVAVDPATELRLIARADPYCGITLVSRLTGFEQSAPAKEMLTVLMEDSKRLLLLPNLGTMKSLIALVQGELGREENRTRLVDRALLTSLQNVGVFLAYAEKTKELEAAFENLTDELGKEENRTRLVDRALLTPLGDLQSFLAYAEKTALMPHPTRRQRGRELRAAFDKLTDELGREENRTRLVDRALLTPLEKVQVFLAYAEKTKELRGAFDKLTDELGREENRPRLVERFTIAPLNVLVNILSAATARDLWSAVFMDVDEEGWQRSRLQDNATTLNALARFQRIASEKGRSELVLAPALALLRTADPKEWQPPNGNIQHLSHVLRCATKATDEEIHRFLKRIAIDEWIDYQVLTGASTGGLAGSLLALSVTLRPDLREPFLRSSLRERVIKELTTTRQGELDAWVRTLSLLGAAAALGLRLDAVETHWPRDEDLSAILELRTPDSERTTIGPLQIQFWYGLREMVRLRNDAVSVAAREGDVILRLWCATHDGETGQSLSPYARASNARMVAWLERCKANGWRLIEDGG
ncbi:MAG: hypothetical protein HY027_05465 [Deltaproteobacteria bacterium]|nr:hypothetical protein [Deltaproteobacteria bacterium]